MHKYHKLNHIETQRILKLPSKMPTYVGKICDMHALLKYAKNAAICEACGNHIYMKLTCLAVAIIPLQISTSISMSFTKCNSVFITKHFTS